MTLHIDQLPPEIEKALEERARSTGTSLADAAVNVLREGLKNQKKRDLSDIAGTWVEDPEFDRALAEADTVDPDEAR